MSRKVKVLLLILCIITAGIYSGTQNFWRDHSYVAGLYTENPRNALEQLTWWELNRHRDQVENILTDTTWRVTFVFHSDIDITEGGYEGHCGNSTTYERNCDYALMRLLFHKKVRAQFPQYDYSDNFWHPMQLHARQGG